MADLIVCAEQGDLRGVLAGFIRLAGLPGIHVQGGGAGDIVLADDLPGVRLGALVDWLVSRQQAKASARPDIVQFSTGTLQVATGVFTPSFPGGTPERLTGREVDLLLALLAAPGGRMGKADLLSYVWGYVPGVETHTLETHVYRLRQKIEPDPSTPAVLLTEDGAYRVQEMKI